MEEEKRIILEMVLANIEAANAFSRSLSTQTIRFSTSNGFFKAMRRMPYAIEHGFVFNRGYNPLWASDKINVSRYGYPRISLGDNDNFYFYDDSCKPWGSKNNLNQYCKILENFIVYLNPDYKTPFKWFVDEASKIRGLEKKDEKS